MDERSEKTMGIVLILFGISLWELLPQMGVAFTTILIVHMSLVLPGVYLIEKPFIKYICFKIRRKKG
jgi:hypothetical protein